MAGGEAMQVSIAIGAVLRDRADLSCSEWLHRADDAMYKAKHSGRFGLYGDDEAISRRVP
jgi:GGDEF domain-containing protein